jgi:hypothetical protein
LGFVWVVGGLPPQTTPTPYLRHGISQKPFFESAVIGAISGKIFRLKSIA